MCPPWGVVERGPVPFACGWRAAVCGGWIGSGGWGQKGGGREQDSHGRLLDGFGATTRLHLARRRSSSPEPPARSRSKIGWNRMTTGSRSTTRPAVVWAPTEQETDGSTNKAFPSIDPRQHRSAGGGRTAGWSRLWGRIAPHTARHHGYSRVRFERKATTVGPIVENFLGGPGRRQRETRSNDTGSSRANPIEQLTIKETAPSSLIYRVIGGWRTSIARARRVIGKER